MQPLCQHCVHLHAADSVEDDGPLSTFHCENNQTAVSGQTCGRWHANKFFMHADICTPALIKSYSQISITETNILTIRDESILCSCVTCVCSFFNAVSQRSCTDEQFEAEASASRTASGHPACDLSELLQKTLSEENIQRVLTHRF